jgi:hypothetical protein
MDLASQTCTALPKEIIRSIIKKKNKILFEKKILKRRKKNNIIIKIKKKGKKNFVLNKI